MNDLYNAPDNVPVRRAIRRKGNLFCVGLLAGMGLLLPPFSPIRAQTRRTHPVVRSPKAASLTGTYTRIKRRKDENQSAILEVTQLRGGKIKFTLTALWWSVGHSDSPHNGEIQATVPLRDRTAVYTNLDYRLTIRFRTHDVMLTEKGRNEEFGAYVSAAGTYRRTNK